MNVSPTRTPARSNAQRTFVTALTAATSALVLTACGAVDALGGDDDSASPKKGNDITLGLLLPDKDTTRYEKFDYPLIKERVASLTENEGTVRYANAEASAATQSRQMDEMIDDGVDVILVDAVDAEAIEPSVKKADEADIPVIAYDRLAHGPIDGYVSHDNELVGQLQGRAITGLLGDKADTSKIVMLNGSPDDPNTALFKQGALSELKGNVVIAKEYEVQGWQPDIAKADMQKAIKEIGLDNIAAVYAANDDMAGGAIEALQEAGAETLPPVTGQDATLAAIHRLISGKQSMTVYKPFALEATNAAEVAVAKVQGRSLEFDALTPERVNSPTQKDIPANLAQVIAVSRENLKDTVIRDGVYTVKDICTPEYAADCEAIGLK